MRGPPNPVGPGWAASATAGAASAVLFASSVWAPPLGFVLCLASPLPVALTAWRRGMTAAAASALVGALAAAILSGPVGAAVYAAQFAAAGCVLGLALRARRSPEAVVGGYALVATVAFWATLGVLSLGTDTSPLGLLEQALEASVQGATDLLLQSDADPQAVLAVQTWAEETGRVLSLIFPGLLVSLALLTGWANALVLRRLTGVAASDSWTGWRAPERWIWVLIGAGLLGLLATGSLRGMGLNVFTAALTIYFLQGLAVIQYLFEVKQFPRFFRAVAYALLFLQLPVALLVAGLGAFDLWIDFRSRWSPPPPARS